MHAAEWIERHGRFHRSISAGRLRDILERKRGECTWCGIRITAPRRTSWCGKACVEAFQAIESKHVRRTVFDRDRGICSLCGLDTLRIRSLLTRLMLLGRSGKLRSWFDVYEFYLVQLKAQGINAADGRDMWQADHTIPVVEGGGLCTAAGLRTLCPPCHKRVSAELASRRSRKGPHAGHHRSGNS